MSKLSFSSFLPIFVTLLILVSPSRAEELQSKSPSIYTAFKALRIADFTATADVEKEFPKDGSKHYEFDAPSFTAKLTSPVLTGNVLSFGMNGELVYGRLYGKNVAIANVPVIEGGKAFLKETRVETVLFNEKNSSVGFVSNSRAALKLRLPETFELEVSSDAKTGDAMVKFRDRKAIVEHLVKQVSTEFSDDILKKSVDQVPYRNVPNAAQALIGKKLEGEREKNYDRVRVAYRNNIEKGNFVAVLEGRLTNQIAEMNLGKEVVIVTARLSPGADGYSFYNNGTAPDLTEQKKDAKLSSLNVYNGVVVDAAVKYSFSQLPVYSDRVDALKMGKGFVGVEKSGLLVYTPPSEDDRKSTAALITSFGFDLKSNEYTSIAIGMKGDAAPKTIFQGTRARAGLETTLTLYIISDRKDDRPRALPITLTWTPDGAGAIRMSGTFAASDRRRTLANPHTSTFLSSLESGMRIALSNALMKRDARGARDNVTTYRLLLSAESEPLLLVTDTYR